MRFWGRPYQQGYGLYAPPLSPAVRALLIINLIVFLIQIGVERTQGDAMNVIFGLNHDFHQQGFFWQIGTYMFLHGHALHLAFNMLVLYFIGVDTERAMGTRGFLVLYFVAGILGGIGWVALSDGGICIGASGAVYGVMGAFAALFPQRMITLLIFFILPVTLRAWVLVTVLATIEFILMVSHVQDGIAHSAHLAGLAAGFTYVYVVVRKGGFRVRIRFGGGPRNRPGLKVLRGEDAPSVSTDEVDRILDKIANEGMKNLSDRERAILERASTDRKGRS